MAEKTQRAILQEIHQVVIGIPGTEEHGMVGDLKETKALLLTQNKRIGKVENRVSKIWGILIGIGSVGAITGAVIGIKTLISS